MRFSALCALLVLLGCSAPNASSGPPRQVQVTGYGTVTTYPDQAEITVVASFTKPRLKESVAEVQQVVQQVMTVVKPFVRSTQDIQTSSVSTNKDYTYVNNKEVFAGYEATQSLTVRLADLRKLEPFMEQLLQTRINQIQSLTYSHTQADSLQREANLMALHSSLKAADKLCNGLGMKRGPVLQVEENTPADEQNGWGNERVGLSLYGKGIGGRSFQLTPNLMKFSGAVRTTVELQ